jgi:Rieske Fe-S protein
VTCPCHASTFSLATGDVITGPATLPQPVYEVRLDGNDVLIGRSEERSLRTNPV